MVRLCLKKGFVMEPDVGMDTDPEIRTCPECGSEETGFFCRMCGALLYGEDLVLCPRCHQVVPDSEFCNQCGQGLAGIALQLKQLAMAGDSFWVTSEGTISDTDGEPVEMFSPDESVPLVEGVLPEWLEELNSAEAPPEIEARIYPSLEPIEKSQENHRNTAFMVIVLLMFVVMIGLIVLALIAALNPGG
jgi:hypothetical protein